MIIKSILFSQTIKFQKKKTCYSCIAVIYINFVLKLNEKYYPQVYLEQCKNNQKKKKLTDFIDAELQNSKDDDDSTNF